MLHSDNIKSRTWKVVKRQLKLSYIRQLVGDQIKMLPGFSVSFFNSN